MLIHSYLYYEKDVNIVSDAQWSKWAMELVQLQRDYPEEASQVEFAGLFEDWDGNSGANLTYNTGIINTAERICRIYEKGVTKIKKLEESNVHAKSKRTCARKLF